MGQNGTWSPAAPTSSLLASALFLLHSAPVLASSTPASLMARRLLLLYDRFLVAVFQLKGELLVLPPTHFNRFLIYVYFTCMPSFLKVLFYVVFSCVKFEQFFHTFVLRGYSFFSSFLVKFCLPVLSFYAVFGFLIFVFTVIIRQLADIIVSFLFFPSLVFSSLSALFSCFRLSFCLITCSAIFLTSILWWLAKQLVSQVVCLVC